MEKEINIAEILKDKPLDIKLWTDIFGEVTLDYVSKNGNGFNVKHHHGVLDKFLSNGKIYDEGTLCIYPSKSMRDWRKFAWKKGDVLVSDNNKVFVVYNRFANEDYTMFKIAYVGYKDGNIGSNDSFYNTADYHKASKEDAKEFIKSIEVQFGGKLNLSTLEIEKPQFKDGDIVFYEDSEHEEICSSIFIFRGKQNHTPRFLYHAVLASDGFFNAKEGEFGIYEGKLRLATKEEKKQLFDALAKENKAWDAEKKAIVDLPKKCEFKPMDWCLMRGGNVHINSDWTLCQFSHLMKCGKYRAIGGCAYNECIPYNDQTAHLLGTTDDWEGGNND